MSFSVRRCASIPVVIILAVPALYLASIWLGYGEAWIHPEQIRAGAYIWTPNTESYSQLLRKAFDWAALDTADPIRWQEQAPAHRVRPLSDLAQVIDALARPAISRWLYPHPSLTPSAIATAVLAPLLFFGFLRLALGGSLPAALFTALWLSSMGFLSVIIPDIHAAAKRLAILSLCLALYLAERHERSNNQAIFWLFIFTLFLSFFTDEMALGGYIVLCGIYAPSLLRPGARWKALVMLTLPALFVAVVRWGLPAMYAVASTRGMPVFDAFGDDGKLGILRHLGELSFYQRAVIQTARGMLTTFGITAHNALTEWAAVTLLVAGSVCLAWRRGWQQAAWRASYGLIASALVLLANGAYLALLDFYPPGDITYLGSYTYYYHSSLSILAVLWLAFAWRSLLNSDWKRLPMRRLLAFIGGFGFVVVTVLNFRSFHNINQLVSLAHSYPYHPSLLYRKLHSIGASAARRATGEVIPVEFNKNCAMIAREFNRIFVASMGETWRTNEFYRVFQSLALTKRDLEYLLYVHYPYNTFDVRISEEGGGCQEPRLSPSPPSGPPGSSFTLSGSAFKPHTEVYLSWGSLEGFRLGSVFADASGEFLNVPVVAPSRQASTYHVFASNAIQIARSAFTIEGNLALSPSSGVPGEPLIVRGAGFAPGENVVLLWDTSAQRIHQTTVVEDGSFQAELRIPDNAGAGTHQLVAVGASSGLTLALTVTVYWIPSASVTPDRALPGGKITVAGSRFIPGTGFYIRWDSTDGPSIGSDMVDGSGRLSTIAIVPLVPAGVYRLYVTNDSDSTAIVPFTVIAPDAKSGPAVKDNPKAFDKGGG
jgi:hypothetical protein